MEKRQLSEKNKLLLQIIIGFAGAIVGLLYVWTFNRYVFMSLPLITRMILSFINYWTIMLIPILVMLFSKDRLADYGFAAKKLGIQLLTGIAIGLAMSFLLTLIPIFVGLGDYVNNGNQYQYAWQFVYEFVYCIVGVSLTEEFVFRGLLFSKLKALSGSFTVALLCTSVLFGLFHFLNGNILQIFITGLIGAFFCFCREKIKNCSLLSLIIAHGIYDALITLWAFVF